MFNPQFSQIEICLRLSFRLRFVCLFAVLLCVLFWIRILFVTNQFFLRGKIFSDELMNSVL